jgi:hypothetical protein
MTTFTPEKPRAKDYEFINGAYALLNMRDEDFAALDPVRLNRLRQLINQCHERLPLIGEHIQAQRPIA